MACAPSNVCATARDTRSPRNRRFRSSRSPCRARYRPPPSVRVVAGDASPDPALDDGACAGALSRSGWMPRGFASTSSRTSPSSSAFHSSGTGNNGYGKRHLAALARLGWLPSFRNPHSFYMRNGRGSSFQCDINKRTAEAVPAAAGAAE